MTGEAPSRAVPGLRRQLGLFDSLSLVVGIVIGSGIFLMPDLIARSVAYPGWILTAWIVTGVLSFFGALAFAELGAMLPSTGGQYVYLREAWGPLPAFLCGWSHFLISQSGALAYLSISFAIYLSFFIPLGRWEAKFAALAVMAVLTAVNYGGVRPGALLQNLCTVAKVAGVAVIIASAFFAPRVAATPAFGPISAGAFGIAMIACLQAYDGWSAISFVAGEVKHPERNLLRALALGMTVVVVVYVLINVAYLRVLSVPAIAASDRVGALTARHALGPSGAAFVAAIILVSILGSLNGRILTQPRVYFAQACDGLFFRRFATVHPRFHTPSFSIVVQGLWGAVLVLGTSFESLVDYRIIGIWLLNLATVAGVIVLRRTRPDLPRPYRMWGYPWTPLAFVLVAALFLVNALFERPLPALIGLAILAAGVPVYYGWRRTAPLTAPPTS
jgi:basic amino acid/polyamine antiporter, APA family